MSLNPSNTRGIYVHVPFCKSRCHFCAFYLEIYHPARAEAFLSSLAREISWYGARRLFADRAVESVYFGGGTPTTLSAQQLSLTLSAIRAIFPLDSRCEVSIEAHPDSMTEGTVDLLLDAGFNRISFGAESMDQDELICLGRSGNTSAIGRAVELARKAGFENISLDLMYGLPGQTRESWLRTLHAAMALRPDHVSCYALTIEERTQLEREIDCGLTKAPDPDIQNDLEALAERELAAAGFHRYEISNYQRPHKACRHNLLYWSGGSYLGLGPSAQSYVGNLRYGNVPDLTTYSALVGRDQLPATEVDVLSVEQMRREQFIFGLRRTEGVTLDKSPGSADEVWYGSVQRLVEENLLMRTGDRIALTERGRRYADSVALQLL